MGDKVDRLSQYQVVMPELPEDLVSECMAIVDSIENRKADVINWDEKQRLDEATKRSGHFIGATHTDYDGEVVDETAGATSDKEKELMSGMGDILKDMEQLDG